MSASCGVCFHTTYLSYFFFFCCFWQEFLELCYTFLLGGCTAVVREHLHRPGHRRAWSSLGHTAIRVSSNLRSCGSKETMSNRFLKKKKVRSKTCKRVSEMHCSILKFYLFCCCCDGVLDFLACSLSESLVDARTFARRRVVFFLLREILITS